MSSYCLRNLRFPASRDYDLIPQVAAKLRLEKTSFELVRVLRRSVDTRRKGHPVYDFTLELKFHTTPPRHQDLSPIPKRQPHHPPPILISSQTPLIVGMGPAGLFCALAMVENGLRPILIDRGDSLDSRAEAVGDFWTTGSLDPESNVQFGEGGAGAFSDGKLTSRGSDPAIAAVHEQLQRFGASESVGWEALPHMGTDGIRAAVRNIREHLLQMGCEFHYRTVWRDLETNSGKVTRVLVNAEWLTPEVVVTGLGNSARDTFRMLHKRGIALEAKPFAVGFRIEQWQETIDRLVYGDAAWATILGAATYRLTALTGFTFCMCPGGRVIAAASAPGRAVTNGMSYAARAEEFCNSAIVTPVSADDFGPGLWDGMLLQESIERSAYLDGFISPAQSAESFLHNGLPAVRGASSFRPGIVPSALSALYPPALADRLRQALRRFDEILPGFSGDATLIAPETRTSSPLRILRDPDSLCSVSAGNLYPIGEGSGYAGGIISSAADGWRLGSRLKLN